MTCRARKFQQGLTLMELMISLTLALIIAAAMIALFVNSKQSFRISENMSRLQENARFAVTFLSRDFRMADYRQCITNNRLANAISGQNDSGLNNSDTVTILWQTNDCGAASTVQTTVYSIQNGASGNPALFRSIDGTSQELVEGIDDLQILYGEDIDGDNVPNYYVDADSVTDMEQAIAVRITLIARTLENNITTSGDSLARTFTTAVTLRNRLP